MGAQLIILLNHSKDEVHLIILKNSVPTSQKKECAPNTKTIWLMLYINTSCRQSAESLVVNHCVLKK
jgi:hypothetical protein